MSLVPIGDRQTTLFNSPSFDLFDTFFDFPSSFLPELASFSPFGTTKTSIDYKETSHAHIIRARLPGMSRDDVEIEVDGDHVVKIFGRQGQQFFTSFTLPENARMDLVQANMVDGYLVIAVPKFETEQRSNNVRVVEITGDES